MYRATMPAVCPRPLVGPGRLRPTQLSAAGLAAGRPCGRHVTPYFNPRPCSRLPSRTDPANPSPFQWNVLGANLAFLALDALLYGGVLLAAEWRASRGDRPLPLPAWLQRGPLAAAATVAWTAAAVTARLVRLAAHLTAAAAWSLVRRRSGGGAGGGGGGEGKASLGISRHVEQELSWLLGEGDSAGAAAAAGHTEEDAEVGGAGVAGGTRSSQQTARRRGGVQSGQEERRGGGAAEDGEVAAAAAAGGGRLPPEDCCVRVCNISKASGLHGLQVLLSTQQGTMQCSWVHYAFRVSLHTAPHQLATVAQRRLRPPLLRCCDRCTTTARWRWRG